MKKQFLLLGLALLACFSALCDEMVSPPFRFDGSEVTETPILLLPTDLLAYSSALAEGGTKSLTITVQNADNPLISAVLLNEISAQFIEGTLRWNYIDEQFADFPRDATYVLTETIVTETETKVLTRNVTLLPVPVDVVISDVNCIQMWPFDRSVIINYTLSSTYTDPTFTVNFYGSLNDGQTFFDLSKFGTLARDAAEGTVQGIGTFKTIWTPDDTLKSTVIDNFKIKVEALLQK